MTLVPVLCILPSIEQLRDFLYHDLHELDSGHREGKWNLETAQEHYLHDCCCGLGYPQ